MPMSSGGITYTISLHYKNVKKNIRSKTLLINYKYKHIITLIF